MPNNAIPDAPWIRDAETNGMPGEADVWCPVCNAENPELFYVSDGDVIGCSECVESVDPWDWREWNGEDGYDVDPYGGCE